MFLDVLAIGSDESFPVYIYVIGGAGYGHEQEIGGAEGE